MPLLPLLIDSFMFHPRLNGAIDLIILMHRSVDKLLHLLLNGPTVILMYIDNCFEYFHGICAACRRMQTSCLRTQTGWLHTELRSNKSWTSWQLTDLTGTYCCSKKVPARQKMQPTRFPLGMFGIRRLPSVSSAAMLYWFIKAGQSTKWSSPPCLGQLLSCT